MNNLDRFISRTGLGPALDRPGLGTDSITAVPLDQQMRGNIANLRYFYVAVNCCPLRLVSGGFRRAVETC